MPKFECLFDTDLKGICATVYHSINLYMACDLKCRINRQMFVKQQKYVLVKLLEFVGQKQYVESKL